MKPHYSILIQWSDADQCYIASLPEFGAFAKTHGETYEQALRNAQTVLGLLVEETEPLPAPAVYEMTHPAA
ncbi:MAG: type II toxin-antitoxin system HicB family antitoxin [Gammaproteobacteria bacterium]|nr:type II toxin-antitoxin system HicB family antitoxin [Gammaproteobacteria bacterium]MDD9821599.1 type II toxin-antitoxin system HicB family antitoxin [Gammaproteobacteria bacterium]